MSPVMKISLFRLASSCMRDTWASITGTTHDGSFRRQPDTETPADQRLLLALTYKVRAVSSHASEEFGWGWHARRSRSETSGSGRIENGKDQNNHGRGDANAENRSGSVSQDALNPLITPFPVTNRKGVCHRDARPEGRDTTARSSRCARARRPSSDALLGPARRGRASSAG